jgi:hypothetical protein
VIVLSFPGQNGLDSVENVLPHLPASLLHYVESSAHNNMKLKLQLFPIDDGTRRALEMVSTKRNNVDDFDVEVLVIEQYSENVIVFSFGCRISIIHTWNSLLVLGKRYHQYWNI